MAENSKDAVHEFGFNAVNVQVLVIQKFHQRLCGSQSDSAHMLLPLHVVPAQGYDAVRVGGENAPDAK